MSNKDQPTGKGPIVASNNSKNTENKDVPEAEKDSVETAVVTAAEDKSVAEKPSGSGSGIAVLSLLLVLALAVCGYLFWQETGEQHRHMMARLDQAEQNRIAAAKLVDRQKTLALRIAGIEGHLPADLTAKMAAVENTLSAIKRQLESSGQALTAEKVTMIDQRLAELEAKVQSGHVEHTQALASLTTAIDELKAGQQALSHGLETLRSERNQAKGRMAVSEAGFLLRIADEALTLRHDADTAVQALTATEQALQGVAGADNARQLITAAAASLQPMIVVDVAGLVAKLDSLQSQIAALPQPGTEPRLSTVAAKLEIANADSLESAKTVLSDVWQSLRTLVTIRRQGAADAPLRAPEQQHFLVENVRLKLATAELALLRGDEATYHASLTASMTWLKDYFDSSDVAVVAAIKAIGSLVEEKIWPPVPDLGPVIEAVHQIQISRLGWDISPVLAMRVWS